jgi:hypothetical protein
MGHRDVEAVGIIVGDVLPVHVARPQGNPAERPQRLEPIGGHLVFVGRHHLGDRGTGGFEPDEEKTVPSLKLDRYEPELRQDHPWIVALVRDSDQPSVEAVGPGVIGAGQAFRAARAAAHQA